LGEGVGCKEARKGCIQGDFERAGDGGQTKALLLTEVRSDKKFPGAVYRCGAYHQR